MSWPPMIRQRFKQSWTMSFFYLSRAGIQTAISWWWIGIARMWEHPMRELRCPGYTITMSGMITTAMPSCTHKSRHSM